MARLGTRVGCEVWVLCSYFQMYTAFVECVQKLCLTMRCMVGIVVSDTFCSWTATLGHRTLWLSPQIPPRMTLMLTDLCSALCACLHLPPVRLYFLLLVAVFATDPTEVQGLSIATAERRKTCRPDLAGASRCHSHV